MDWGYFSIKSLPTPFDDRVIKVIDNITEASVTSNIKGLKGATGFIRPSQWKAKKKSLEKSISNSTGYIMVDSDEFIKSSGDEYRGYKRPSMLKMKPLLERIDYQDTASQIVKSYGLNSKIKFGATTNKADYNWMKDIINLRRSYSNVKEFIITVLHEIKHALDAKKMGKKRYEKAYQQAGDIAVNKGKDFHDDNKFEEVAEEWGKKEYLKWKNKI